MKVRRRQKLRIQNSIARRDLWAADARPRWKAPHYIILRKDRWNGAVRRIASDSSLTETCRDNVVCKSRILTESAYENTGRAIKSGVCGDGVVANRLRQTAGRYQHAAATATA